MSKKTVEITLKSLEWEENGELDEDVMGNNVLSFDLIYPSPGNINFNTVKRMKLKDKGSINFEDPKFTYGDRILFKEEIVGESELSFQLTDVQTKSGIDKFLGKILKGLYSAVFGALTGSIANVVVGIPLKEITGRIDSIETDPKEKVNIIGENSLSIKVDELPKPGERISYSMVLKVPSDVIRNRYKYDGKGNRIGEEWEKVSTRILEGGKTNGRITIDIGVL